MSEQTIRLTQYSHGAGCGCKISPKVLETILHSEQAKFVDPNLLVGNETRDDAAVYDLGNGTSIISTTDFFMPIVDNPFDFGRIAATNAISDIFAMGGKPIMAIAILGWPINTLAPEIARDVIDGGRFACQQAGIALAGGHSIDAPEPIFGLAVTGVVPTERVKRNSTAQAGCKLFLTKPLGIGVLTTAEKKSLLKPEHKGLATEVMCQMNLAGAAFANIDGVKAMTDVTGFGLAGHLLEICRGSGLGATVRFDEVPLIAEARTLVRAAAAVSVPFDLTASGHQLARGLNRLYTRHFLATLKPRSLAKLRRFPGLFDETRMRRARNLWEFDDAVTGPVHGFAGADDYWSRSSAKPWLKAITVPALVVNPRNDPFLPAGHLPGAADVAPAICLEQPAQGGHVGFVSGPWPGQLDWLPRRLVRFFTEAGKG